jgi:hypothetical protein
MMGAVATSHPNRLNSDEVALVLRRAADLEAQAAGHTGADDGFDASAVEEAAREVGLSPAAVRQAMAELHTGDLTSDRRGRPAVARPGPSIVQVARLVPCAPAVIHTSTERFLRRQTLEVRRRQDQVVLFRQRRDFSASLRRGFDFNGAIKLEGVNALTVTVTPIVPGEDGEPGRCMVRMVAELRGRAVMNALASAGGLTAASMTAVPAIFVIGTAGAAGTAVVAGAGVTAGGLAVGHSWWRRRREQVAEVLDGFLDSFEGKPALGA